MSSVCTIDILRNFLKRWKLLAITSISCFKTTPILSVEHWSHLKMELSNIFGAFSRKSIFYLKQRLVENVTAAMAVWVFICTTTFRELKNFQKMRILLQVRQRLLKALDTIFLPPKGNVSREVYMQNKITCCQLMWTKLSVSKWIQLQLKLFSRFDKNWKFRSFRSVCNSWILFRFFSVEQKNSW